MILNPPIFATNTGYALRSPFFPPHRNRPYRICSPNSSDNHRSGHPSIRSDLSFGKSRGGLFGKFGGKRNKNGDGGDEDEDVDEDVDEDDEDDEEEDENDDLEDDGDDDEGEDDSKVQRVQVEGVTDVHPVGESGGLAKKSDDGDAGSDDGKSGAKDEKDKSAEPSGELDLNSVFAEEEEVDELLKDLADSEEEVNVDDLAAELQKFLSKLEKRTAK